MRAALARAAQILGHKPKTVRARGLVADFTPEGFAELAPRAAEAGLCPSGAEPDAGVRRQLTADN